jgi:hypothetical protein
MFVTDDLLMSMLPFDVIKESETTRSNTTTLTDDPDLQIALEANASYHVAFYIHYSSTAAAGFKTAWSVPPGAAGLRACWGVDTAPTNTTNPTGDGRWGVHAFATETSYGTRNGSSQVMAWETGDVNTSSAGVLALQWAQTTSNAGTTRVAGRSYMRVERIA